MTWDTEPKQTRHSLTGPPRRALIWAFSNFILVAALILTAKPAAAADLSLGTWERNLKKSRSSGQDPWKRQTLVREAVPGGVKVTVTAEMTDGTNRSLSYTALYDGTPVRVIGAPSVWDTVATRQIDQRTFTFESFDSRGGKYRAAGRSVLSKNGKRMTTWQEGTNANGKEMKFVVVYDRVR